MSVGTQNETDFTSLFWRLEFKVILDLRTICVPLHFRKENFAVMYMNRPEFTSILSPVDSASSINNLLDTVQVTPEVSNL